MLRLGILVVTITTIGLLPFDAYAWMEDRAPEFKRATKEGFDLLNYRYLWNDDAEKARMIINPASKKKEADDWKPRRKLTEAECTKLIRIMTDRFGEPAKCRNGYASFVYVWRFEDDEWLSVGVCTMANKGGDPIAIFHWDWNPRGSDPIGGVESGGVACRCGGVKNTR